MAKPLKLKDVEIRLDNDRKVYEMGEKIRGTVRVTFTDETFDQKKLLETFYALPKTVSGQTLRSGTHEIPFRFRLPNNSESPPSFDGRYGCINYFVECLIENQELHRTGVEIKLECPTHSNLMLSVSGSSEKDLGLFCIGSGNVTIEASIARKGHIPGETIKLRTLINNATTLKVQARASLYQTQIFMSGDRHRTLELVLSETHHGNEVDSNDVTEDFIEIPIPIRAQLTMKSTIITVKYFVHVTLDIPHNIDLHINLPIVVTNRNALLKAQQGESPGHSSERRSLRSNKTNSTNSSVDLD